MCPSPCIPVPWDTTWGGGGVGERDALGRGEGGWGRKGEGGGS